MADNKNIKFTQEEINNAKEFTKAFRDVNEEVNDLFSGLNSISDEIKGQVQGYQLANKAVNNLTGVFGKLKDIQDDIKNANSKDLKSLQEKAQAEKKNLIESQRLLRSKATSVGLTEKEVATLANLNGLLETQDGLYQNIEDTLNQIVQNEQIVETTMGNLGAITEGLSSGLKKAGLGAIDTRLNIEGALKNTKDMVVAGKGNISNLESAQFLAKQLGTNLLKSVDVSSLVALGFKEMYDALVKGDTATGKLAKDFNISYLEASNLRKELNVIAAISNDVNVNTEGLQESMVAVGKTLGSNAQLNKEDLITFTKLREQAGYTNEELASMQTLSLVNGKSLEDNTEEVLGSAKAYASQNKLLVNEKEVLREVGKASASLKLSLGGSTSALAESVVKAKQFGLNLEQASKISSGLLNFESSISSELEAELLTGKDLNLEQARLLALNGKTAEAAAEIAKQVGSSAEFGAMNVIQQEAIAKATGLNREELAQSLIDKEALAKLSGVEGKDAKEKFDNLVKQVGMEEAKKQLGDEQLATQFEQQSLQERFNKGIEKLRDNLMGLAQPILDILSPLMDIVNFILPTINLLLSPIVEGFRVMGVLLDYLGKAWDQFTKSLEPIMPILKGIGIAMLAIAANSMKAAIIGAYKSVVGIPYVGPVLAAAAAVGAASFLTTALSGVKIEDGIIDPKGGLVVSGEKGTFKLNENDSIVAGTNLNKISNSTSSSTSINLTPLVERMAAVENLLTKILTKEGSVYLDGTKVGTAMSMSTYKTQ